MSRRRFPLRVLYHYPHLHMDTGSPRALVNLIDLLNRERFEPWFLATGAGPLLDELEQRGVTIVRGEVREVGPRRPLHAIRAIAGKAAFLRRHGIDLLHMHEFGRNQDLVLAAGSMRVPVILHLHNPACISATNLHAKIASRVLMVSGAQEETIEGFDRIRSITSVLHNTIDVERYGSGRSLRPSLGLLPEQFAIGCVAQIKHIKGIDLLLKAARCLFPSHPELVLLLVGPPGRGEEGYADRMRRESADPVFGGRVRFLGSRDDIPDVLASLDAFILPTRREPFGIAIIEAMAAGLPVIASGIGGIPEIIASPQVGILLPEVTAAACVEAVEALLALPDRGHAMGERGRASLLGRFDPVTVGGKLERTYLSL